MVYTWEKSGLELMAPNWCKAIMFNDLSLASNLHVHTSACTVAPKYVGNVPH